MRQTHVKPSSPPAIVDSIAVPVPTQTQDRERQRRSEAPTTGIVPSVFRTRFLPWLRDSAWPRLILVGFHVAEVCERTIPLASLVAALGDWMFLAPLAMAPGMCARYVARRALVSRAEGDGVVSAVKSALKTSLVRVGRTIHNQSPNLIDT